MIILLFLVILTTKFPVFICNSAVLIWNKSHHPKILIKVPLCFQNTDILPFIDLILTNHNKYFRISDICKSCINNSNDQIQELKKFMKIVSEIT